MKNLALFFTLFISLNALAQNQNPTNDTLSLLFIGDIMGHDSQILSAYNPATETYNYHEVFEEIAPVIRKHDYGIANLEVVLGGKPYKGYPQFSSPDELAVACKNNGINVLVTANNHSCDKGKVGVQRTVQVLDSLDIRHTGTFKHKKERSEKNLLILSQKNLRVGLLNYTYGTNGLPTPEPTFVNRIDTSLMASDIRASKKANLDKLIVFLHWGTQYESHPNKTQENLAGFLLKKGVDIIIGSHPHVLQRMEYHPGDSIQKERLVVYSLGNYVSNQRTRKRDGGAMVRIVLVKSEKGTHITDKGYYLTWVNKFKTDDKWNFQILPASLYEKSNYQGLYQYSTDKLKLFLDDSRTLLDKENINVPEIK